MQPNKKPSCLFIFFLKKFKLGKGGARNVIFQLHVEVNQARYDSFDSFTTIPTRTLFYINLANKNKSWKYYS